MSSPQSPADEPVSCPDSAASDAATGSARRADAASAPQAPAPTASTVPAPAVLAGVVPKGQGALHGRASASSAQVRAYPEVAFSESRSRLLKRCPRAYYHNVYTAHEGWSAAAGTPSYWAFRCKSATPLAAAVGNVVHAAATRCVRAVVAGLEVPSYRALRRACADQLNTAWRASLTRRTAFLRRPRDVPGFLLEALYGDGPTADALARARATLERALDALVGLDEVWEWVRAAGPEHVWIMDPFSSFMLDDGAGSRIRCYAAADLIVRPTPAAPPHVVEIKCGGMTGVVDQLLTYAVASRAALRLPSPDGVIGVTAALGRPGGAVVATVGIAPEEIDAAADRIRSRAAVLQALVADPSTGAPLAVDAFPQHGAPQLCGTCAHRGLCWPDEHPLRIDTARRRA